MFPLRTPIAAREEAVSGLDVHIVFGTVYVAARSRDARPQPVLVRRLVFAEARVAVDSKQAFVDGDIRRDVMVGGGERYNQLLYEVLHVLPGVFVVIAMLLEPIRSEERRVGKGC